MYTTQMEVSMLNKSPIALALISLLGLSACNSDSDSPELPRELGMEMTILHINDHHSNLDPVKLKLHLPDTQGKRYEAEFEVGGFSRVAEKFAELERTNNNVLKLHAGDAITGTPYYSLTKGRADAAMMNEVCFDSFVLGNHEFDDGNEQLATFIDYLNDPSQELGACGTQVISANVEVPANNPIYGKYTPYSLHNIDGEHVAVIGLTISDKTQGSSSPDRDTVFLDEVSTAQFYIDELKAKGIDKIVLLTHYMYSNDIAMAKQLRGVDVIVGGDSHSLLGSNYANYNLNPHGEYPTVVQSASGDDVCIVQAMDNSQVVGELQVSFDTDSRILSCGGQPHLLLGDLTYDRDTGAPNVTPVSDEQSAMSRYVSDAIVQELLDYVAEQLPEADFVALNESAEETLQVFRDEVDEIKKEEIGVAADILCNERLPGSHHSSGAGCHNEVTDKHGSVMGVVVAQAFADMSKLSDLAIQNTGGVRTSMYPGTITYGDAIEVLPFDNLLVNVEMTGAEIVKVLNEAADYALSTSTGAFPATAFLRFDADMNANEGEKISNVQVRAKQAGSSWQAIEQEKTYVVVTNDFIAEGRDGYYTMGDIWYADDGRVDHTGLLYTDSLVNYIKQFDANGEAVTAPALEDMSVQHYTPAAQ
ncbi:5'-nucleotidase C-terminal domain-containing protein [Aliagarivorans marinus]|uniref:5'-nucleotidase C-terminal domain-containing protein n=1 Tax=Aliagarivorans marinus TaxID=561965 RepID=UPI0009FE7320|nr:5'-nucleotidase C-terminal domain-containing protein [Aliagarivorans marinus]